MAGEQDRRPGASALRRLSKARYEELWRAAKSIAEQDTDVRWELEPPEHIIQRRTAAISELSHLQLTEMEMQWLLDTPCPEVLSQVHIKEVGGATRAAQESAAAAAQQCPKAPYRLVTWQHVATGASLPVEVPLSVFNKQGGTVWAKWRQRAWRALYGLRCNIDAEVWPNGCKEAAAAGRPCWDDLEEETAALAKFPFCMPQKCKAQLLGLGTTTRLKVEVLCKRKGSPTADVAMAESAKRSDQPAQTPPTQRRRGISPHEEHKRSNQQQQERPSVQLGAMSTACVAELSPDGVAQQARLVQQEQGPAQARRVQLGVHVQWNQLARRSSQPDLHCGSTPPPISRDVRSDQGGSAAFGHGRRPPNFASPWAGQDDGTGDNRLDQSSMTLPSNIGNSMQLPPQSSGLQDGSPAGSAPHQEQLLMPCRGQGCSLSSLQGGTAPLSPCSGTQGDSVSGSDGSLATGLARCGSQGCAAHIQDEAAAWQCTGGHNKLLAQQPHGRLLSCAGLSCSAVAPQPFQQDESIARCHPSFSHCGAFCGGYEGAALQLQCSCGSQACRQGSEMGQLLLAAAAAATVGERLLNAQVPVPASALNHWVVGFARWLREARHQCAAGHSGPSLAWQLLCSATQVDAAGDCSPTLASNGLFNSLGGAGHSFDSALQAQQVQPEQRYQRPPSDDLMSSEDFMQALDSLFDT